jgi:hypothetical protein
MIDEQQPEQTLSIRFQRDFSEQIERVEKTTAPFKEKVAELFKQGFHPAFLKDVMDRAFAAFQANEPKVIYIPANPPVQPAPSSEAFKQPGTHTKAH